MTMAAGSVWPVVLEQNSNLRSFIFSNNLDSYNFIGVMVYSTLHVCDVVKLYFAMSQCSTLTKETP